MGYTTQLEGAVALALKLPPGDRLRLVERVVASVERDIARGVPVTQTEAEHWGQALNRLLDALDMSDWEASEINDPVEWVKALRRQDESRLDTYWNNSQRPLAWSIAPSSSICSAETPQHGPESP